MLQMYRASKIYGQDEHQATKTLVSSRLYYTSNEPPSLSCLQEDLCPCSKLITWKLYQVLLHLPSMRGMTHARCNILVRMAGTGPCAWQEHDCRGYRSGCAQARGKNSRYSRRCWVDKKHGWCRNHPMRSGLSRCGAGPLEWGTQVKYEAMATRKRRQYWRGEMTVGSLPAPPRKPVDLTQVSSCLSQVYCTSHIQISAMASPFLGLWGQVQRQHLLLQLWGLGASIKLLIGAAGFGCPCLHSILPTHSDSAGYVVLIDIHVKTMQTMGDLRSRAADSTSGQMLMKLWWPISAHI